MSTLLRRMARDAYDSGALYLGCMAENFEGVPLTATMTVTVLGAANAQGAALSTGPQAIAAGLKTITPRGEGDAWRKVTTVEIPEVGVCARTFGVEDVPVEQDDSLRLSTVILPIYRWAEQGREVWRRPEKFGFGAAYTYDRLSWRVPFRDGPWFGALPTLTAAAGVTERMRLGTMVTSVEPRSCITG